MPADGLMFDCLIIDCVANRLNGIGNSNDETKRKENPITMKEMKGHSISICINSADEV